MLVTCFEPWERDKGRLGIAFHQRRSQGRGSLRAITLIDPDVGAVDPFGIVVKGEVDNDGCPSVSHARDRFASFFRDFSNSSLRGK